MRNTPGSLHWRWVLAGVLLLGSAVLGDAPVAAQAGSVTSSATPSNATPGVGQQVVVSINIDMSGVNAPDNKLGSFTGTLDWNPAVIAYGSDSGILAGFTGLVNTTAMATGHITFNGASAMGGTGNIVVLTLTFDVIGEGTSTLNLGYSVMAATLTFTNLLPILTVTDGQVVVGAIQSTVTPTQLPATATPTATSQPALTHTPTTEAATATPTASPPPQATVTPTPTGVPTAVPTVTPAPTERYWTYLSLLLKKAAQPGSTLPLSRALDWKCISNPGQCCVQSHVAPRLFPRLAPFCPR